MSFQDVGITIIAVFVLAFSVVIGAVILYQFSENVPSKYTELKDNVDDGLNVMYGFDKLIIFFAVGMAVISIISAFMINVHPIFFVIGILINGVMIVLSIVFKDLWNNIVTSTWIAPVVNNLPLTDLFLTNLPIFSLIISVLLAIAMYAGKNEGGYSYN